MVVVASSDICTSIHAELGFVSAFTATSVDNTRRPD